MTPTGHPTRISATDVRARSRVTVDLDAVRANVRTLRELAHPAELWAVVKADAYGHGASPVAAAAVDAGAAAVCVAATAEAVALRETLADARIVVLGPTAGREHGQLRAVGAEVVVGGGELPDDLPVHLKIDTGMGRAGIRPEDVSDQSSKRIVGVMTHLAMADDTSDDAFTRQQLASFERVAAKFPDSTRHAANTAATIRFAASRYDAVRCGIGIYGLSPFADRPAGIELRPALRWETCIAALKTLRPGESTGYGRRFTADRSVRIGLVPVGYADGLPRALRGADVIVDGHRCEIVGTPSMDSLAVRVPTDTAVGAVVTIVGDGVTAEQQAAAAGTLNYEFVCSIGRDPLRCERIFDNA
jgi:alanine racemase